MWFSNEMPALPCGHFTESMDSVVRALCEMVCSLAGGIPEMHVEVVFDVDEMAHAVESVFKMIGRDRMVEITTSRPWRTNDGHWYRGKVLRYFRGQGQPYSTFAVWLDMGEDTVVKFVHDPNSLSEWSIRSVRTLD